jgi:hypothetical protein
MLRDGLKHGFPQMDWNTAKEEARAIMIERAMVRGMIPYSNLVKKLGSIKLEAHDPRIMFLYARSGSPGFEQDLLPLFVGTPAENEYRAMAAHHTRVVERRRAHEMRNDPEEIVRRKALQEAEKQERLARRAVRKVEIDRVWRERPTSQSQSGDG